MSSSSFAFLCPSLGVLVLQPSFLSCRDLLGDLDVDELETLPADTIFRNGAVSAHYFVVEPPASAAAFRRRPDERHFSVEAVMLLEPALRRV